MKNSFFVMAPERDGPQKFANWLAKAETVSDFTISVAVCKHIRVDTQVFRKIRNN